VIALLAAAAALGLAGAGHCIGMCGGVAGMLCGGTKERTSVRFIALYNAGRLFSYAAIGAIAGGIGASASSFPLGDARTALRILAAVVALFVGLGLLGVRIGGRFRSPVIAWLRPIAAKLLPIRSAWQALALGAVWGWLPCGMVYGATVFAVATGTMGGGALVMAIFGLGTLPAMLTVSTIATRISSARWLHHASGVALVLSGVWWSYGVICANTQKVHDGDAEMPVCAGHALGPDFALHANHDEGTRSGRRR
jgi:sulfite exporter TauE/SafE